MEFRPTTHLKAAILSFAKSVILDHSDPFMVNIYLQNKFGAKAVVKVRVNEGALRFPASYFQPL